MGRTVVQEVLIEILERSIDRSLLLARGRGILCSQHRDIQHRDGSSLSALLQGEKLGTRMTEENGLIHSPLLTCSPFLGTRTPPPCHTHDHFSGNTGAKTKS